MISHTTINLLDNPDQSTIQNCVINDSTWSHFHAELVPCIVVVLLVYMDGKREKRVILQYGTDGCGRGEERREEGEDCGAFDWKVVGEWDAGNAESLLESLEMVAWQQQGVLWLR